MPSAGSGRSTATLRCRSPPHRTSPSTAAFALSTVAYMVFIIDVPMLLFVGQFYEGMLRLILPAVPPSIVLITVNSVIGMSISALFTGRLLLCPIAVEMDIGLLTLVAGLIVAAAISWI